MPEQQAARGEERAEVDDATTESLIRYAESLAARLRSDPTRENAEEVIWAANRCEKALGEGEPWRIETVDSGRILLIYRGLDLVRIFGE